MSIEEFRDYDARPVEGQVVHPPQRTHYVVTPRPVPHGSTASDHARTAVRVAISVPRGAWRVGSKLVGLTLPTRQAPAPDPELAYLRSAVLFGRDPSRVSASEYATVRRLEDEHAAAQAAAPASGRIGCMTLIFALFVAGFFALWAWLVVDAWLPTPLAVLWQLVTPVVIVVALGAVGWAPPRRPQQQTHTPQVHPLVATWLDRQQQAPAPAVEAAPAEPAPDLSAAWIIEALEACGVPDGTRLAGPAGHTDTGWQADVILPRGTTAAKVVRQREALASALGRPAACVSVEARPALSPAHVSIHVADRPMTAATCPPWPYAGQREASSIWQPVAFGADTRGRSITVPVAGKTWLIGGQPGMGKTVGMLGVLGYAALDPRTVLHVLNLKGGADFAPYRAACATYVTGSDPDALAQSVATLRALQADMRRAYAVLEDEGHAKVTDALASRRDLAPHVLVIDECQELVGGDSTVREDAVPVLTDLVKRARALGWVILLGTQKPTADAIPTAIRDQAQVRVALKVGGQRPVDVILGDGAYSAGYDASAFGVGDVGRAWVLGEGADPVVVQIFDAEPGARAVGDRAAEARAMLDPTPAQEAHEDAQHTPAARLLALWPADRTGLQWPEVRDLIGDDATAKLRDSGVPSVSVRHPQRNPARGCLRRDVETVATP